MISLPPEIAPILRPVLADLADEIIATIAREVPEYSRAMEGEFGVVVRHGVEVALGRFADEIERPAATRSAARDVYVNLGRGELHAGRSLDALLAAYRVGARVAWRRFVEAGVAAGLRPSAIYRLGEAIFEYIDEISAESAEGYAAEQMVEAGERRRRSSRLVALMADGAPAADVRAAAREAGWEPPRLLAALVTLPADRPEQAADRLARDIGLGSVAGVLDGGTVCALVADPDAPGRRRALEALVAGRPAAIGPTVEPERAALSIRRAAAAHRIAHRHRGLTVADEHLPELLMTADPAAAADLAARRLAPLASVPEAARVRLEATLAAWLDRPGQVQAVAEEIGVHPQTVRYRLRRLRELFGPSVDVPDARFELQLALRARALLAAAPPAERPPGAPR